MQGDQTIRRLAQRAVQPGGQSGHRPLGSRVRPRAAAHDRRHPAAGLIPEAGRARRLAIGRRPGQLTAQGLRGRREHPEVARLPRGAQPPERVAPLRGQHPAHRGEQLVLLHPAAREGVQAERASHPGIRRQVLAPGRLVRRVGIPPARRAQLVQQQQDRLAEPAEDLHLGLDVAGGGRRLGGVDQVEHDIALVLHVADRLLAAVERPVGEAVPHLGEQPADRVLAEAQTPEQARAVAESRRVPQPERLALRRVDQHVALGGVGHVRLVPHLADVAPQERACQRGLADVGVGHEAQRHGGRGGGGHGGQAETGGQSAARTRSTAWASGGVVAGRSGRSRKHARRPRAATNVPQAARRSTSRGARPASAFIRAA